jgi:hypothetical protein
MAGSGLAHRPDGAASGLVDSLCALSLTTDPGELAYRLIHRAMARALVDLIEKTQTRFEIKDDRPPESLSGALELQLDKLEFNFDRQLLEHPADFSGLAQLKRNDREDGPT